VERVVRDRIDHAEAARDLLVARVAQHGAVRADHRDVAGVGDVLLDDDLRIELVGRRQQVMRVAVATQEVLQPHDGRRRRIADQHRAAVAALDQRDAAQDQRARDALAELGLGDQQRAQVRRVDQQHVDVGGGMAIDQRRPARQLADLGEELAGPVAHDRHDAAEAVALRDRDLAVEHDEHPGAGLAGRDELLAGAVAAAHAEATDAAAIGRIEGREQLVAPGVHHGRKGRHDHGGFSCCWGLADILPARRRRRRPGDAQALAPRASARRTRRAAVAASAGKNVSSASSDRVTSTGVPNTVVVLMKESRPSGVSSTSGTTTC
jgi:hypothetical protein